jgi:hypothetical protein
VLRPGRSALNNKNENNEEMKKLILLACAIAGFVGSSFTGTAGGRSYEEGFDDGWARFCQTHNYVNGCHAIGPHNGTTYEDGFTDGVAAAAMAHSRSAPLGNNEEQ